MSSHDTTNPTGGMATGSTMAG